MSKIKTVLSPFVRVGKGMVQDFKNDFWYRHFPAKPLVVNMLANDICNSKCVMCNIWEQKLDFEFTPEQLGEILGGELFTEVRSVGVTGGEPTMREDLPELYEAACQALPNLRAMSIITNAIRKDDVIERITAVHKVLQRHGKKFSIMVSLDGYGEVHDRNRRRPGNFESAMEVINHFRNNTDIPVMIGCTITKENVWDVDELLDFLIAEGIHGRFRVAEFITRLYNNELTDEIRNFNAEEKYHLACFFKRLETTFEPVDLYQRTYRSIIHMLSGGQRLIGCPYQEKGAVLDSKGNLLYCAPKSNILGSTLDTDGWKLYKNGLAERRRIRTENCSDCIHDYHAPATTKERWSELKNRFWTAMLGLKRNRYAAMLTPFAKSTPERFTVFVTGWYGTETVGDKAILGAILQYYREQHGDNVDFIISAFVPFHTERTLIEMGERGKVVSTTDYEFIKAAATAHETVMGGGPLMGIESLSVPLSAFRIAKKAGRKTVVFGCGIGPLRKEKHLDAVRDILDLSDVIRLRDKDSVAWGKELLTKPKEVEFYGDPAYDYVRHIAESQKTDGVKKPVLACFLRDWSKEYQGALSDEEFAEIKHNFEVNTAATIKALCAEFNLVPHFYCMHTFVIGGDDRVFYRRFIRENFAGMEYHLEDRPATVEGVVGAMQTASINLCMRYHSVLFARTLETNFLAIDYTQGGKIKGYLKDEGELDRMFDLKKIAADPAYFSLDSLAKAL